MSYSRIKGMQYAKEHINKFKEQYPEYDIQNNKHTDCANFASQVLHEGGVAFSLSALLRFLCIRIINFMI